MNAPTPAHGHTLYAIFKTGYDAAGTEPELCDDTGLERVSMIQVSVVPDTIGGTTLARGPAPMSSSSILTRPRPRTVESYTHGKSFHVRP
jgi:hypothetical protein